MTTPATKSSAFCPTPAHHKSVLHVLAHELQLDTLWGNQAFFVNATTGGIVGELGRTRTSCRDLCGFVEIRRELWTAYGGLWKLLVSRRLRMKSKKNAWTCNVPASDFRGLHDFLAERSFRSPKD